MGMFNTFSRTLVYQDLEYISINPNLSSFQLNTHSGQVNEDATSLWEVKCIKMCIQLTYPGVWRQDAALRVGK